MTDPTLRCVNGHVVAGDAAFCPTCGAPFGCPTGHSVTSGAAFCAACGVSLRTPGPATPRPASRTNPPTTPWVAWQATALRVVRRSPRLAVATAIAIVVTIGAVGFVVTTHVIDDANRRAKCEASVRAATGDVQIDDFGAEVESCINLCHRLEAEGLNCDEP
jgi:hypothetical protein